MLTGDPVLRFEFHEIGSGQSTRDARLKWVVVVDRELSAGRLVNAAVCVAAATTAAVSGVLGRDGTDGDGTVHPGLPWAGCVVLAADANTLRSLRAQGIARPDVFVADMPVAAQETRVYDDYLERLHELAAEKIDYAAVSIVGPRNRIDRMVRGLALLG
jgi:hypothetical protein